MLIFYWYFLFSENIKERTLALDSLYEDVAEEWTQVEACSQFYLASNKTDLEKYIELRKAVSTHTYSCCLSQGKYHSKVCWKPVFLPLQNGCLSFLMCCKMNVSPSRS